MHLLGDVASASERHAIKIDETTSGLQIFVKRYNAHNKVANILTKLKRSYGRNEITK